MSILNKTHANKISFMACAIGRKAELFECVISPVHQKFSLRHFNAIFVQVACISADISPSVGVLVRFEIVFTTFVFLFSFFFSLTF